MVFTWAEKLVLENVSSCVDGDWRCFTVTIKEPTVKYLVRKNRDRVTLEEVCGGLRGRSPGRVTLSLVSTGTWVMEE